MDENEELSQREIDALKEDELYIQIAFMDDRWTAMVVIAEKLRRQLQATEARMRGLMDEKAVLQETVKQLERQVRIKLKPNTRERINGRPF